MTTLGREGQVALMTGAAQGLGRAVAFRLAAEGAAVAVNDLDPAVALRTALELRGDAAAIGTPADVSDPRAVRDMVDVVTSKLGPVDVLVNNAAVFKMTPFESTDDETWERTIQVNFVGPVICIGSVVDSMIERGRGWIVSVSSVWGLIGAGGASVYCATKGAIVGLTQALGEQLEGTGVVVSAVAPGMLDSPQLNTDAAFAGVDTEEMRRYSAASDLLGRAGDPAEIAGVISYLASPAGSVFHGQTVPVSGGRGE